MARRPLLPPLLLFAALTACGGANVTFATSTADDASAGAPDDTPRDAGDASAEPTPSADWTLTFAPSSPGAGAPLSPALLGEYDLSGALYRYDEMPGLVAQMPLAGMREWRVGLGRWEFATQLLPSLTDGTSCTPMLAALPSTVLAPAGTTDLDLLRARDWFTYTDGAPVTAAMTEDDARYALGYVRSVLDVAQAFGASPYLDIDHMPRALAANQTPTRTNAEWSGACGITWTNRVSNVRPADPSVFAAAVAGLVKRLVEGSGGEPGRPVRYVELWNEPELAYAWNPDVGDFGAFMGTAAATLSTLAAYRVGTSHPGGRALRIGVGSFAEASTAVAALAAFDHAGIPLDFVSFHGYDDDPLVIADGIAKVAAATRASTHFTRAELALAEWGPALQGSKLDPTQMDVALHHATVLALGAAAGLTHAHHSILWDFIADGNPGLGLLDHALRPKPAFYAFAMMSAVIGEGAARIAPAESADGRLDGGMGAVLASRDAAGTVRVLLVNRNAAPRTVAVGATPRAVSVFDDPARPPRPVAPTAVITLPPRSLALVER